ncbi:MAG: N-acyl homoserine lactonase family protein [Pseudomonadota bacterium]
MKHTLLLSGILLSVAACGGSSTSDTDVDTTPEPVTDATADIGLIDQVELHVLDCGTIEISDLNDFSIAGDFAGETDINTNTCWLVRHPDGDLLWDTGLPGMLAGQPAFEQDIYTVSLDTTLTQQLRDRGISASEIEFVSISHSAYDRVGQVDQVSGATWLVHENEYAHMFPDNDENGETATQFAAFATMKFEMFSEEKDVFGDGSVIIFPTPGHTPGHTSLEVHLPEFGPVLLTGDLYHRTESRELSSVPRLNTDEALTLESMAAFEARAERLGAKVVIQNEMDDIAALPDVLR